MIDWVGIELQNGMKSRFRVSALGMDKQAMKMLQEMLAPFPFDSVSLISV